MSHFKRLLAEKVEAYVELRQSLGYRFRSQAATLRDFARFVHDKNCKGPLTDALAIGFVGSCNVTPNVRAWRHGVIRRFAEYLAIFDPRTRALDPRALPRCRAQPPARILTDAELARLLFAARRISGQDSLRGQTLETVIGLLASTGLRSGEALRLDRVDVDLSRGLLRIRQTKFRKDRLVPVHVSALRRLRSYVVARDMAFPAAASQAFFLSTRGRRLGSSGLSVAFRQACKQAGLDADALRAPRPHDLRHRFAVTRIATWHREGRDVQAALPALAAYLGHARYTDTAYYVTGTAELLALAAERAFGGEEDAS